MSMFEHNPQLSQRYVYGIQSGQFIKVGVSLSIKRRLDDMRLLNPHPATVVYKRKMYAAYHCEKKMHEVLAPKSIGREWFDATLDEVRAAAKIGFAYANEIFQRKLKEEMEWNAYIRREQEARADAIISEHLRSREASLPTPEVRQ